VAAERSSWGLIDLFSGCGGASGGFLATGAVTPVWAADNDRWANQTYEHNLGHRPHALDLLDLATSHAAEWARSIRKSFEGPFCLIGGPPCQGFSSHVKTKVDRKGRNTLYGAFVTLALALRPERVVIENVPDLFAERNWPLFEAARARLIEAGYQVRARIINFADLGVPQERFRAVVIASRVDQATPIFPTRTRTPDEYSTVKEWIGDLPSVESGQCDPRDPMHQASRHSGVTLEIIRRVPLDGGSRPVGVGPACLDKTRLRHGGYTDVYGRLAWLSTAPTITARCRTPSCGRFLHPEQNRGLTAREAALLQTFPRDWHLCGPFDDRFKQIGNAVPPKAAQALAGAILKQNPTAEDEVGVVEIATAPIGTSFSVLIPGIRKRGGVLASNVC
jgi:DNA (cytosine-5)-methyltransferase 1